HVPEQGQKHGLDAVGGRLGLSREAGSRSVLVLGSVEPYPLNRDGLLHNPEHRPDKVSFVTNRLYDCSYRRVPLINAITHTAFEPIDTPCLLLDLEATRPGHWRATKGKDPSSSFSSILSQLGKPWAHCYRWP